MAYLAMMAIRLVELHRVLKDTGSSTCIATQQQAIILRFFLMLFLGLTNFRNEIIWQRTNAHNDARHGAGSQTHVFFLLYGRSHGYPTWNRFRNILTINTAYIYETDDEISARDISSPNPRPNLMYECERVSLS